MSAQKRKTPAKSSKSPRKPAKKSASRSSGAKRTSPAKAAGRKTAKATAKKPAKKAAGGSAKSTPAKKTTSRKPAAKPAKAAKTSSARAPKAAKTTKATTTKSSSKKPSARKTTAKKPAKTTAKKPTAKKPAAKKPAAKTTAAKKPVAKTASKKPAVKKATSRKTATRTTTAKKPARTTSARPAASKAKTKAAGPAKKTSRERGTAATAPPAAAKTTTSKPVSRKKASPKVDSRSPSAPTKTSAKKKVRPIETETESTKRATATAAVSRSAKSDKKSARARARVKGKNKGKSADGRQPGQAMRVPPPVTDVLITAELPDVRRAKIAAERQEESRGHLVPDSPLGGPKLPDWDEPVNASLMMSALAAEASPKIEDNYDYTVLEDFETTEWCPSPTRMVNTACGGGEAAVHFAKRGFRCVGIDSDRSQIGLARERAWLAGVDIDFMVGDLFETPNLLPAESFGLAIDRGGFALLEGARDRQRYLSNVKRLLFQGGIFVLSAGYFPFEDDSKKSRKGKKLLLAREGGVVVNELRQGGFDLLQRVLRQTQDSGELAELILYLRKP